MTKKDPQFFSKLGEGQTPSFFVVSCCDSRTCPSTITGMPLGEMFTHRNIANQVIEEDESFRASLHYALDVLKVNYVIVLGHTRCGGVLAASTGVQHESMDGWLKHVRASLETFDQSKKDPEAIELEEHNVRQQVQNVKNHPVYQRKGQDVPVIGLLFHLESGELKWLD
ncbi:carbonate dehydratase [Salipaludibacillus keqinensis]|uniref:carbonic anhydrase n=2 Tax=Salipaludibacillus keqinensis TaxID=2045207 RepID=A0A323TE94_9BACI|nr:carbonate dehydratase [Salipaludibacillus keqinensis]